MLDEDDSRRALYHDELKWLQKMYKADPSPLLALNAGNGRLAIMPDE